MEKLDIHERAIELADSRTSEVLRFLLSPHVFYNDALCKCLYCRIHVSYTYRKRVLDFYSSVFVRHTLRLNPEGWKVIESISPDFANFHTASDLKKEIQELKRLKDILELKGIISKEHITASKNYFGKLSIYNLRVKQEDSYSLRSEVFSIK